MPSEKQVSPSKLVDETTFFWLSMPADDLVIYLVLIISAISGISFFIPLFSSGVFPAVFGFVGAGVFGYVLIMTHRTTEIREARFLANEFKIRGSRFKKVFAYSQIERVTLTDSDIRIGPWKQQISVWVKGEVRPLVLHRNYVNKKLKIDLYSWLTRKTQDTSP